MPLPGSYVTWIATPSLPHPTPAVPLLLQAFLFSCQARAFRSWLEKTRENSIRRRVFVQKQQAVQVRVFAQEQQAVQVRVFAQEQQAVQVRVFAQEQQAAGRAVLHPQGWGCGVGLVLFVHQTSSRPMLGNQ